MEFTEYDTRLAAYAVITGADGAVLLSRLSVAAGFPADRWTLPGGGVELHERIEDAVVREVREETGYDVELSGLLGVDTSVVEPSLRRVDTERTMKAVRVVYRATVVGGALTHEAEGTTDEARWVPADQLAVLGSTPLVVLALRWAGVGNERR